MAIDVTRVCIVAAVVGEDAYAVQSRALAEMFSFVGIVTFAVDKHADPENTHTLRERPAPVGVVAAEIDTDRNGPIDEAVGRTNVTIISVVATEIDDEQSIIVLCSIVRRPCPADDDRANHRVQPELHLGRH